MTEKDLEGRMEAVREMYDAGLTPKQMQVELGLSIQSIYRYHSLLGKKPNKPDAVKVVEKLTPEQRESIVLAYTTYEKMPRILAKYGMTYNHLYQLLAEEGVEPRIADEGMRHMYDVRLDHAVLLYDTSEMTIAEITEETGINQNVLHNEVHRRGIGLRRGR